MLIGLSAALVAAVLFGVLAVVQAVAVRDRGFWSWPMAGVAGVYLIGWVLHMVAIDRLPLFLAQVAISASLVITALSAAWLLNEPLRRRHWVAIAGVVLGLGLLATTAGPVGDGSFGPRRTAALYACLVGTLLIGLLVRRVRGRLGGVLLGFLAGVAYAGSPIASRALIDPPWAITDLVPAATIGLYGLLGFWFYSEAMARASVTAATAPVVVLQTMLPAILGVLLFGDRVDHGEWPLAVAAFVLSLGAAVVLCGAEARLEERHRPRPQPRQPTAG